MFKQIALFKSLCSTHLCVGEVDISSQVELSNQRVMMKSFMAMPSVSSKMIISPLREKSEKGVEQEIKETKA